MVIDHTATRFALDIVAATKANDQFRRVLWTGTHAQVVVMSIPPGGDVGDEVHHGLDQVLVVVEGRGLAFINGEEVPVGPDHLVHVASGARHNVVNTGSDDLRLYTVYAPPEHAAGTIHRTKADAAADGTDHFMASGSVT